MSPPAAAPAPAVADTTAPKAKKSKFNIAAAATPQGSKRAVTEVGGKNATAPPTKVVSRRIKLIYPPHASTHQCCVCIHGSQSSPHRHTRCQRRTMSRLRMHRVRSSNPVAYLPAGPSSFASTRSLMMQANRYARVSLLCVCVCLYVRVFVSMFCRLLNVVACVIDPRLQAVSGTRMLIRDIHSGSYKLHTRSNARLYSSSATVSAISFALPTGTTPRCQQLFKSSKSNLAFALLYTRYIFTPPPKMQQSHPVVLVYICVV